jgi:spectinomycin phosphotransferase
MLQKPDLANTKIVACLLDHYGLPIVEVTFLPLGADPNAAVYRVETADKTAYFLKLKRGDFDETAVLLPKFLHDQGIPQIIAPIPTRTQQLWTSLDSFNLILYPFVEGQNGFELALSDHQWAELGTALKHIHTIALAPALLSRLKRERYTPRWRDSLKTFLARAKTEKFDDPTAIKLAALLNDKRDILLKVVGRSEQLAQALQAKPLENVLCHTDIHGGNVLLTANNELYLVDWDTPMLAPKERDLMFVSGAIGDIWYVTAGESRFFEGYGQADIDPIALTYYRYERCIEDLAVTCEGIFLTDAGGADREQSLHYVLNQFLPNGVIEIACNSEQSLPPELRSQ